ncbi:MAG: TetR/AcrR family transcriptional regulator [Bacteroidota bacterium]
MNTRTKIKEEAIELFNQRGFGSVSIQDIANHLEVNRRNIAYHFPDTESLLKEITDELWEKLDREQKKRRDFPSFENLYNEVKMYVKFQQEYAFIFHDLHVMKHPLLEAKFREMCLATIRDNEAAIAFAIKLGNMKPEPFPGAYHNLCLSIWVLSLFWLQQQTIRGVNDEQEVHRVYWSLILPHFTQRGIDSFKNFFGEVFYDQIGEPFSVQVDGLFF